MDQDDPSDWSLDRVIQELCYSVSPPWMLDTDLKPIIKPEVVATALTRNDIDGQTLLELGDQDIKSDLGITSFGQRRGFRNIVEHLRSLSTKYQTKLSQARTTILATPQLSHTSLHSHIRSPSYAGSAVHHSVDRNVRDDLVLSHGIENGFGRDVQSNDRKRKYQAVEDTMDGLTTADSKAQLLKLNPEINQTISEPPDTTKKSAASASDPAHPTIDLQLDPGAPSKLSGSLTHDNAMVAPSSRSQQPKTPKRAVLIPMTDRSSTANDAAGFAFKNADIVMHDHDDYLRSSINDATVDQDNGQPAKRLRQTSVSAEPNGLKPPPITSIQCIPEKLRRKHVRRDQVVFGKAETPAPMMDVPDEAEEDFFSFVGHSNTRARMHRGILRPKSIFGSAPQNLAQQNHNKLPTSAAWQQIDPLSDLPPELLGLLQRNPVDHNERSYPNWLESDEEDIRWETESEISHAQGPGAKGTLSQGEIDAIIDETLELFREEWRVRYLPNAQLKARKKWMAAAENLFLHEDMLIDCRKLRDQFTRRVQTSRQGIHFSEWRKPEDVKQQCLAIEASVQNLEEYNVYIAVLESEHEPLLPSREALQAARKPRSRIILDNGDEELDSDTDSFVVEDPDPLAASTETDTISKPVWAPIFTERPSPLMQVEDSNSQYQDEDLVFDSIETTHDPSQPAQLGFCPSDDQDMSDDVMDIDYEEKPHRSPQQQTSTKKEAAAFSAARNPMVVPYFTDSSDDTDFDRSPRRPHTKYRKKGKSEIQAIDLTMSSSPSRSERSSFEVRTPALDITDSSLVKSRKHSHRGSRTSQAMVRVSSSSEPSSGRKKSVIYDVSRVQRMAWQDIEPMYETQAPDSRLALAKAVYHLKMKKAQHVLDYIRSFSNTEDMKDVLQNGLVAAKDCEEVIVDVAKRNQKNAELITQLLICYATGCEIDSPLETAEQDINEAHLLLESTIPEFRELLQRLLQNFLNFTPSKPKPNRSSIEDGFDGRTTDTDASIDTMEPDLIQPGSAVKRRKQKEAKSALKGQLKQLNWTKRLEEKRAALRDNDISQTAPINVKEPLVYLDPGLANKVKIHQLKGIQFLWREIIENPRSQGCLLAHTMGLGKTMQVISFLACIAQCNASEDPEMRQHIPQHLQRLRILIICPQALIENWYEEFQLWLPERMMLGLLLKLDGLVKQPESTIEAWFERGGVLITSYERFRNFAVPSEKSKTRTLESSQMAQHHITKGPDIVIADEAHRLKNATSKINLAANRIETKSRIALTGSPLNNHLEEYHTMINWISPGYLGSMRQFKERYVEPIHRGLYNESTAYERKISLKKLHMLKHTLGPKVDRADITAISHDLPPKVEFFLTIDLTVEQKKAYGLFVQNLRASTSEPGHTTGNTRLWSWLGILSLLLSHPECFIKKLQRNHELQVQAAHMKRVESEDGEHDGIMAANVADDIDVTEQPELKAAMDKVIDVFAEAKLLHRKEDASLSNKSLLIKLILQEATALNEKTLIFSQSIPTLDYYESMVGAMGIGYKRIDGQKASNGASRQKTVEEFNTSDHFKVFLISTRAGGLGLNIQSATRVIINDFNFNPAWEEQAIGRAYRMGQNKPVFVYRFLVGGTFEELVYNKTVFKTQLFTRVVDEKNVVSQASKKPGDFLFDPKPVPQQDFAECLGKDPGVLDRVLDKVDCVRNIVLTETFFQNDDEELDEKELKEADEELEMERLEREDPAEYKRKLQAKREKAVQAQQQMYTKLTTHRLNSTQSMTQAHAVQSPSKAGNSQSCAHSLDVNARSSFGAAIRAVGNATVALSQVATPSKSTSKTSYDDTFVGHPPSFRSAKLTDDQSLSNARPRPKFARSTTTMLNGQQQTPDCLANACKDVASHGSVFRERLVKGHTSNGSVADDPNGTSLIPSEIQHANILGRSEDHDEAMGEAETEDAESASGCRPQ